MEVRVFLNAFMDGRESMLSPMRGFDHPEGIDLDGTDEQICERVWMLMNRDDRPNGQSEPSLSVGDVVVVDGRRYVCADVGWKREESVRERVLAGERIRVEMNDQPENAGVLFERGGQFVYEVTDGFAAGVSEPICFVESDYLEASFLRNFREVSS